MKNKILAGICIAFSVAVAIYAVQYNEEKELREEIETLTLNNEKMQADIDTLTLDNETLRDELDTLQKEYDTLKGEKEAFENSSTLLNERLDMEIFRMWQTDFLNRYGSIRDKSFEGYGATFVNGFLKVDDEEILPSLVLIVVKEETVELQFPLVRSSIILRNYLNDPVVRICTAYNDTSRVFFFLNIGEGFESIEGTSIQMRVYEPKGERDFGVEGLVIGREYIFYLNKGYLYIVDPTEKTIRRIAGLNYG